MPKRNRHGQAAILSDTDYLKIRKQLQNESHRLMFDIARWTGERWGAIRQLQTGDVYADPVLCLPHDHITFRAATRKAAPGGDRLTRQVPTHPQLRDILLSYNPPIYGSSYLFPGTSHDVPIGSRSVDQFFRAAVARAGLDAKGISLHSTRRTFITRLHDRGVSIHLIRQITGHRDLKALTLYIENSPQQVRAAIEML